MNSRTRLTALVTLCLVTLAHAQDTSKFVPSNAPTKVVTVLPGQVLAGRLDAWAGSPDFFCRQSVSDDVDVMHPLADGTPKCYAKGMVLGDIGDAPDLVLRRAGPDRQAYNGDPAPVPGGVSLGGLYWQAWGGRCEPGQYGYWSGCGGMGRTAQIYSRTVGEQTAKSRAGSLHLATTPLNNNGNPVDRIVITEEGRVILNTLAGMKEIQIGAADSCGTGYRCLRVPN